MCRALRFVVLGALLAVPLAAAEPAQSSSKSVSADSGILAFDPMSTAQVKSCPIEDPDCNCHPQYTYCPTRTYNSISFVNQKPNYVCVYVCYYTDTCYDTACGRQAPIYPTGTFRVRSEPYEFPWGGCPAANISFCSTMSVDY